MQVLQKPLEGIQNIYGDLHIQYASIPTDINIKHKLKIKS